MRKTAGCVLRAGESCTRLGARRCAPMRAGHITVLETPDAFHDAVGRWLASIGG